MEITFLQLVKFKRFALNNIEVFTLTPTRIIQLILGTNGSGKSSLMSQLSPMPADSADFLKGGSKKIKITHRGHKYTLTSTFEHGSKHSFIIHTNGEEEELNKGGTGSVQKELIRQHFGMTQDMHDLFTGLETFHSMSPSRRREWFTRLSDVSYDYALGVYARLKEKHRDISGALKLAKKRLVTETSKVISEIEEAKLKEEVDNTHRELNLLIERSAPLDRPIAEYKQDIQSTSDELFQLSKQLLRIRFTAPDGVYAYGGFPDQKVRDEWGQVYNKPFTSIEDVQEAIDEVRHQITAVETLLNAAVKEHGKIEETIRVLTQAGENDLKTLQTRLEEARKRRDSVLAKRILSLEGIDPTTAKNALETVYELLEGILIAIPENEDRRFSQSNLNRLNEELFKAKEKKLNQETNLNKLIAMKTHLETHKNSEGVNCPNCSFRWVPGYSDEKFQALVNHIEKAAETLKATEAEIKTLEEELQKIREYADMYRSYTNIISNWPALNHLWEHLGSERLVIVAPRKALSVIKSFRMDLEQEMIAKQVTEEITEITNVINSVMSVGDANLNESKQKLADQTALVEKYTSEYSALRKTLSEFTQFNKQLSEAYQLGDRIDHLYKQHENLSHELVEAIRRDTLNHCVRQLQHALAIKQETLSVAKMQKGIIADIQGQIDQLALEEETAKHLLSELSPTDGLIAEGMLGFIRVFVQQMNGLLKKIWAYPLQVMDCGISTEAGAELDYKFPLMVQTKANTVPDVKFGSSGMHEVVNLAFKVVAAKYLNLADAPLFLDEFAARLDAVHRVEAMDAIKNLLDTQSFSQVFMISHNFESHGAFNKAEICVLDARNIVVPAEYNLHVTIQ